MLTLAIYARSIDDPLIYWDDNLYILDDARIQELSPANAWKILTESFAANYHPLTTFTFAVDRALWGGGLPDETWGFHLTQLGFYAGGVVLLYFVFRSILGSAPAAFAGAAIYATHTIHVESVAWLASRKDVVCLFFYAAAMLAYVKYARERARDEGDAGPRGFYVLSLPFVATGILLVASCILLLLTSTWEGEQLLIAMAAHALGWAFIICSLCSAVCSFFYVGWIIAYEKHTRKRGGNAGPWVSYAAALALAVLAMLSKGYAVVLPGVFIAYDLCFARRFRWRQVVDKLPLLALGAVLTFKMIVAQDKDATPLGEIDTYGRLLQQCKIYAVYVGRTILPVRLSINYCYVVRIDWLSGWVAGLGALLGAGTVAAFFVLRRRLPAAAFGIAVLVMQLGTVMSVFITLRQWMTDRYLFFPTIGSTLALAAGGLWLHGWLHRSKSVPEGVRRYAVPAAAVATVALYSGLTVARLGDWRSELAIWSDAARKQLGLARSGPLALWEIDGKALSDFGSLQQVQAAYGRAGRKETADAFMAVIARYAEKTVGADPVKVAK
ncbi:MAG: hypothetical protein ACYTFI_28130, partial [Planctomycetota bacterium]